MFMSKKALVKFFEDAIADCENTGVMFSLRESHHDEDLHPIVFGHAQVFYKELFEKYGELFDEIGVNPNNGLSSVTEKIKQLPESKQEQIQEDLHKCYEHRPEIAMVDSVKGITNLHAQTYCRRLHAGHDPQLRQDVGPDGKLKDTKVARVHLRHHLSGSHQLL